MGISVTTVTIRDALHDKKDPDRLERYRTATADGRAWRGGNVDAWFLDALLERLAPHLPKHIFSQGVAPPPGPGDLAPEQCATVARALRSATAEDVVACYLPIDGIDPAPGLDFAATIAVLALRAAEDSGLAVF